MAAAGSGLRGSSGRSRILIALPDHPWPADMGSRVRNLAVAEALAERFEIASVTLVHDLERLRDPGPLAALGPWTGVPVPHRRGMVPKLWWHLRRSYTERTAGLHRETYFQSLPAFSRAVERQVGQWKPGLVHAAYWYGLRRIRTLARPPLWVLDTHDVQFERHERLWNRRSPRERAAELRELRRYDAVVAITRRDRETLLDALDLQAPPVEVIPMGLDLRRWHPGAVEPALPPALRVGFYGSLASASNEAGAVHLMADILPRVRAAVADVDALILGATPSAAVREAGTRFGARVTGFVEDPRPWLRSLSVLALTLRTGSGQRGRVVEAVALGIPVVGYREALQGLDLAEGEGILGVDDADRLVHEVADLLRRPDRAAAIARRGGDAVRERYGREATYLRFPALYASMLGLPAQADAAAAAAPTGPCSRNE